MRTAAALCAVLAALILPAAAHAGAAKSPAEKLMDEGTRLFNAGRLDEALASFEAARKLAPEAAGPLRAIGMTLSRLDRCAEAVVPLEEWVSRKPAGAPEAAEARATLERCKALLVERTTLSVTSNVPGAVVRLDRSDGPPAATTPVDRMRLAPGPHAVHVAAPGYTTATARIEATPGAGINLHVELLAVAAPAERRADGGGAGAGRTGGAPWPWIAAAGGGAAIVVGVVIAIVLATRPGLPERELGPPFRL